MNKRMKQLCRVLAMALALCLAFPFQVTAATIDEVKARQEELAQENAQLEEEIAQLKEDESAALEYQAALEEKIGLTEQKIDAARESIQLMDGEILVLEQKLDAAQAEYQDTLDAFAQRVSTLYKAGSIDTLEILLTSESFTDFALRTELLAGIARHDQEIVDRLEEYQEATQADREEVERLRQEVAANKRDLEASQDELKDLNAENAALIDQLVGQQLMAEETIQQNETEDAELNAQLEALLEAERKRQEELAAQQAAQQQQQQQQQGSEESSGEEGGTSEGGQAVEPVNPGLQDGFSPIFPCPGYAYISGHFGEIYPDGNPHYGLDIAAVYGTPIIAAQAGTVVYADYHWSWGNNVLISHNATYATRYAHCSSLAVSVGQYVEQGQIIGYVGSTGNSEGNHLHFEVYYNSVRVDPDPYLGI